MNTSPRGDPDSTLIETLLQETRSLSDLADTLMSASTRGEVLEIVCRDALQRFDAEVFCRPLRGLECRGTPS